MTIRSILEPTTLWIPVDPPNEMDLGLILNILSLVIGVIGLYLALVANPAIVHTLPGRKFLPYVAAAAVGIGLALVVFASQSMTLLSYMQIEIAFSKLDARWRVEGHNLAGMLVATLIAVTISKRSARKGVLTFMVSYSVAIAIREFSRTHFWSLLPLFFGNLMALLSTYALYLQVEQGLLKIESQFRTSVSGESPRAPRTIPPSIAASASEFGKQRINDALRQAEREGMLTRKEVIELETAISELDALQLHVLQYLDDPPRWIAKWGVQIPPTGTVSRVKLLEVALPELSKQEHSCSQLLESLRTKGLISDDPIHTSLIREEALRPITTPIGHKLAFIVGSVRPNGS